MRSSSEYLTSSFQEQFKFFPYIVIYMILLYFCLCILFAYVFANSKYTPKPEHKKRIKENETCCEICCAYITGMFCCCSKLFNCLFCCCSNYRPSLYFDALYESHWSLLGTLLLLIGRIVLAAFIIFFDVIRDYQQRQMNLFLSWVHIALAVFFVGAAVCSFIGLTGRLCCQSKNQKYVQWSRVTEQFGVYMLILYECVATNIIFSLIIQFITFSDKTNFEQIRLFLVPAGAVIFELLLNKLPFRPVYYGFTALLPMAYLIFQWVLVYTDVIAWQYSFLDTKNAICFRYYSIMVGIHIAAFLILSVMYALRDAVFGMKYVDRFRIDYDSDDNEDNEGRRYNRVEEGLRSQNDREIILENGGHENEEDVPTAPPLEVFYDEYDQQHVLAAEHPVKGIENF